MDELTEIVKNSYNELKQAWTNNHKIHPTAHRRQLKRLGQEQPMLYAWMVRNFGQPRVEGEDAPALETTMEDQHPDDPISIALREERYFDAQKQLQTP